MHCDLVDRVLYAIQTLIGVATLVFVLMRESTIC
jgi:hypothetical protein